MLCCSKIHVYNMTKEQTLKSVCKWIVILVKRKWFNVVHGIDNITVIKIVCK